MPTNIATRVRKHRQSLRHAGLRPLQIWVPDTRRAGFSAECLRQSQNLNQDNQEIIMITWLESIADHEGWQ